MTIRKVGRKEMAYRLQLELEVQFSCKLFLGNSRLNRKDGWIMGHDCP